MSQRIPDVHKYHLGQISGTYSACFPQFGIIFDGSPFFAEAECVVARMVTKDWEIIEILVHLGLYENSLDSDDIVSHVKTSIEKRLGADPKYWRTTMMDRASANKSAMEKVKTELNASPLPVPCLSHGLSGNAKKFKYEGGKTTLKGLTKMAKHKLCKARTRFRQVFLVSPIITRGVRWGVEYEHCDQTNKFGLRRILNEYVSVCANNKWSEESAKGLLTYLSNKQQLAKAMVEIAAVVDVGGPFIAHTYTGEAKQPMVFVAAELIRDLDAKFARGLDNFDDFVQLEAKAEEAADLMSEEMVSFSIPCTVLLLLLVVL